MKIACIGWGSLIWDPRDLLIKGAWLDDGPLLPVEFLRKSSDGRMTLVLDASAKLVQSLWCVMDTEDLETAKWSLGRRENKDATQAWIDRKIGVWTIDNDSPSLIPSLADWAKSKDMDTVIWTNLRRKHPVDENEDVPAGVIEVVAYLKGLKEQAKKYEDAKRYVLKAPAQIDTNYRQTIVKELGW